MELTETMVLNILNLSSYPCKLVKLCNDELPASIYQFSEKSIRYWREHSFFVWRFIHNIFKKHKYIKKESVFYMHPIFNKYRKVKINNLMQKIHTNGYKEECKVLIFELGNLLHIFDGNDRIEAITLGIESGLFDKNIKIPAMVFEINILNFIENKTRLNLCEDDKKFINSIIKDF